MIASSASHIAIFQFRDDNGSDIFYYFRFILGVFFIVGVLQQKHKRFFEFGELFQFSHTAKRPFVIGVILVVKKVNRAKNVNDELVYGKRRRAELVPSDAPLIVILPRLPRVV